MRTKSQEGDCRKGEDALFSFYFPQNGAWDKDLGMISISGWCGQGTVRVGYRLSRLFESGKGNVRAWCLGRTEAWHRPSTRGTSWADHPWRWFLRVPGRNLKMHQVVRRKERETGEMGVSQSWSDLIFGSIEIVWSERKKLRLRGSFSFFSLVFKSNFSFIAKLRGKDRDFHISLPQHLRGLPIISVSHHQRHSAEQHICHQGWTYMGKS